MAAKEPIAILFSEVDQHPAALAWRQLNDEMAPQAIEVLQKQRKSEIYRLLTGITGEESIIAKRCVTSTGKLEKVIYEEILPFLSISQLHYYGSIQETDSYMWLFLADAGKTLFSTEDASHRVLGAHWLGRLHRFAQKTRAAEVLPERGVPYYFALMQSGREIIVKNLANPLMTPTDIDVLQKVLTQMDTLESNWSSILKVCETIPQTLAHGDFRPKNVHIKQTSAGNAFYAMDWEMAGWGNPVVDLAPARGVSSDTQVDVPVYISIMQEIWPDLDESSMRYFVQVGCILRRLAAIYWASLELSPGWIEGPVYNLKVFHRELSHAMGIVLGRES
jgi:phosphotransferase family enzyme